MTEKNIRQVQNALLFITNPIRSRIPSILSSVLPHVEQNLYVIVENSTSNREEEKLRIRTILHAIYKQLTGTKSPSVDVLLHNLDLPMKSNKSIR